MDAKKISASFGTGVLTKKAKDFALVRALINENALPYSVRKGISDHIVNYDPTIAQLTCYFNDTGVMGLIMPLIFKFQTNNSNSEEFTPLV
jgi:hypothetical protein